MTTCLENFKRIDTTRNLAKKNLLDYLGKESPDARLFREKSEEELQLAASLRNIFFELTDQWEVALREAYSENPSLLPSCTLDDLIEAGKKA